MQLQPDLAAFALAAALLVGCAGRAAATPPPCSGAITDAAWLAGDWVADDAQLRVHEHWSAPAGGVMLGHGHTVAGAATVFFEYLRIESRDDGLVYVAHPRARAPGVEFRLARCAPGELEFVDPAHDHPRQITYRREPDGALSVRLAGEEDGEAVAETLRLTRPHGR